LKYFYSLFFIKSSVGTIPTFLTIPILSIYPDFR